MGEEHRTYHLGADQTPDQRLTVAQAAAALGITEGAVRSRIKRGALRTTNEVGGLYVLLSGGTAQANQAPNIGAPADHTAELIATLREQLAAEREANRENRRIIAALTARIPEMEAPAAAEAPPEPREAPTEATEQPGKVES